MDLHVRRAHPGEADALSDLAFRAKASWGYPPDWLERWRAELTIAPDYLRAHVAFVALDGDVPVGVCVLERQGTRASLEHVWIAPEYHKRGVGRALVARALAAATESGAATVDVLSDPFAEPFYARLGASRVRQVPAPMPGSPDRVLPLLVFNLRQGRGEPRA